MSPVTPPRSHRIRAGARRATEPRAMPQPCRPALLQQQGSKTPAFLESKQAQGTHGTNSLRAMAHRENPCVPGHSRSGTARCRRESRPSPHEDGENTGGLCHLASTLRDGELHRVFLHAALSPTRRRHKCPESPHPQSWNSVLCRKPLPDRDRGVDRQTDGWMESLGKTLPRAAPGESLPGIAPEHHQGPSPVTIE